MRERGCYLPYNNRRNSDWSVRTGAKPVSEVVWRRGRGFR